MSHCDMLLLLLVMVVVVDDGETDESQKATISCLEYFK